MLKPEWLQILKFHEWFFNIGTQHVVEISCLYITLPKTFASINTGEVGTLTPFVVIICIILELYKCASMQVILFFAQHIFLTLSFYLVYIKNFKQVKSLRI